MISRRDFLKAAGIAVIAAQIPGWLPEPITASAPTLAPLYGRVLHLRAGVPQNAILPISALLPQAYQTPVGEVERTLLQPMLTPAAYHPTVYDPPFTAEVTGALAPLRRYCSASAEVDYWIGHGGVLQVVDRLDYDGITWYGVYPDPPNWLAYGETWARRKHPSDRIYWTQSPPLAPLTLPTAVPDLAIHIDRAALQLTAFQRDHALFSVPYAAGNDAPLSAGSLAVRAHQLAKFVVPNGQASTLLTFGDDLHIGGAYWHNRFGENTPGHAIQLPPYVAKWLYGAASIGTPVMIA